MAENGLWLKLWCTVLSDTKLMDLPAERFGLWVKLALLTKKEGSWGVFTVTPPCNVMCMIFGVTSCVTAVQICNDFPGVTVTANQDGTTSISFDHWPEYQEDNSREKELNRLRQKSFRERHKNVTENVTEKSRKKVTLRNAIRASTSTSIKKSIPNDAKTGNGFDEFWGLYPKRESRVKAEAAWKKLKNAERAAAVVALPIFRFSLDPQYIPLPASWLNAKRWEDEQAASCDLCNDKGLLRDGKPQPCPKCGVKP